MTLALTLLVVAVSAIAVVIRRAVAGPAFTRAMRAFHPLGDGGPDDDAHLPAADPTRDGRRRAHLRSVPLTSPLGRDD